MAQQQDWFSQFQTVSDDDFFGQFQTVTPSQPKPEPGFFSRSFDAAKGFGSFLGDVIFTGMNPASPYAAMKMQEVGRGVVEPFKNVGQGVYNRDIGQIGTGIIGLTGADPEAVAEDWQSGNYGALLGDFALPATLAGITRGARVLGPRMARGAATTPKAPLPIAPETPRFYSGVAGVGDTRMNYPHELGPKAKVPMQDYSIITNPEFKQPSPINPIVREATILPGESLHPIVPDIGAELAAGRRVPMQFEIDAPTKVTPIPGRPAPVEIIQALENNPNILGAHERLAAKMIRRGYPEDVAWGRDTGGNSVLEYSAPFSHPRGLLKPTPKPGFNPEPKTAFKPEFTDQFINPGRITDPARLLPPMEKIKKGQKITPDELRKVVDDSIADPNNRIIAEAINLPRGVMATDLTPISSSMFRQAYPLIGTKAWWGALDDMTKAWGSEKAYEIGMKGIREDPILPYAKETGLKLTELADLTKREEAIAGTWAEKIPVVGPQVVRRSNRSYTLSLDKIRVDHFKNLVRKATDLGLKPKENLVLGKQIAEFINNASGRGSLGKLERIAGPLNTALFSPRNLASRIKMLDPKNYLPWMEKFDPRAYLQSNYQAVHPFVRKQYWHSLGSMMGAWAAMRELAALGGASIPIDDPTNSDFGKIVIGDTRIDPGAGFLQELVLASRMWKGEKTSSTSNVTEKLNSRYGGPNYLNVPGDFLANKLSPVFSYAYDWATQSPSRPFRPREELVERMLPMIVTDILEVNLENPELFPLPFDVNRDLGPMTGVASLLGMGTQTYTPRQGGNARFIHP